MSDIENMAGTFSASTSIAAGSKGAFLDSLKSGLAAQAALRPSAPSHTPTSRGRG